MTYTSRLFRVPRVRKSTNAQLLTRKKYAEAHPAQILARRQANAANLKAYNQKKRSALRIETLSHYGPSGQLCCSWVNCHISDIDMLVLDHTADNGAQERNALGGRNARGWNFYELLKANAFPEGYQTLCCNHNHKKEILRSRTKS